MATSSEVKAARLRGNRALTALGLPFLLSAALIGHGFWSVFLLPDKPEAALSVQGRDLQRRVEEWMALPLAFTLDMSQQDSIQRFTEEQERLKKDLAALASGNPPVASAGDALVLVPPVTARMKELLTSQFGDNKDAVAHEYVESTVRLREGMVKVAEEASAAELAQETELLASHRLGAWTLAAGLTMLGLVAVGAVWLLRSWLASWFGELMKIAVREGAVAEAPPATHRVTADEARDAVEALAQRLAQQRGTAELQVRSQDMLREFTEALETVDDEEEIVLLFLRCLSLRHPRLQCQLLLADQSEEELRPVVAEDDQECACAPLKPNRCKAMRLGRALRVDDPDSIAACPRMQQARPVPYGCVPLSIAGRSAAVLRMVSQEEPVTLAEVLDSAAVAQRFAVRVGVQRLLNTTTRQARTDPLTGLPNRRVGVDHLDRMIKQSRDSGKPGHVAILGLDLDHFKKLNDTYGHAAGDQAIRGAVAATKTVLPEEALFARMGGEEFLVAVPVASRQQAMAIGDAICRAVRALVQQGGSPATTVSIGVALAPEDGADPQLLMGVADDRLYMAKNSGRDRAVGPEEAQQLPPSTGLAEVEKVEHLLVAP